jgi:hypothetical protein
MVFGRMIWAMAAVGLTGGAVSTGQHQEQPGSACTATGGDIFNPALTSEQICTQFRGALGRQAANVRVSLRFSPRGTASARVSQLRAGQWHELPLLEMAVMDRRFNHSDIDQLARDVLGGLTAAAAPEGN